MVMREHAAGTYAGSHKEIMDAIIEVESRGKTIADFKALIDDPDFSPLAFAALMNEQRKGNLDIDVVASIVNSL